MSIFSLFEVLRLNFLFAEKYSFPKGWSYFESAIPYSMIRFILKGNANFMIDDTAYYLEENDIIHIPQGSKLTCDALGDDFTFISIRFAASFPSGEYDMWSNLMGYDAKIKCKDEQVKHYFESIIKEKDSAGRGKHLVLRGFLELILGYVLNSIDVVSERTSKPRTVQLEHKNDQRIQTVLEYMANHFERSITIDELSKIINVSSTTFRRLFKQHTGKTPSEFLIELKMTAAAKRILETDERISDISYYVGIDDPNYFSRIFKRHFGVTPNTYRKLATD